MGSLTRSTQPEPELQLLIQLLKLQLPPQPPRRIATVAVAQPRKSLGEIAPTTILSDVTAYRRVAHLLYADSAQVIYQCHRGQAAVRKR